MESRIGLISDTHGLLRPEASAALAGADLILHAGDVGAAEVLVELERIAPVRAVRGNVDRGTWARRLPGSDEVHAGGARIYVIHSLEDLALDPAEAGFAAVVSGHSHQPSIETREGVLFVNPGAAGPRRFHLPITVGLLRVSDGAVSAEIVPLFR
ncbi:MAG: metallophosphoesterase family protein [Acidobacteria bacterium]|nr:metallophosphoesterase family protein [Acidobacteriota bacterium]